MSDDERRRERDEVCGKFILDLVCFAAVCVEVIEVYSAL
jgi:hypothetical protein